MTAKRRGRARTPRPGAIPEAMIEAALPRIAADYDAHLAHPPQGDPVPDAKAVIAHYAAADAILAHFREVSGMAQRAEAETPDATLAAARAQMAGETPEEGA
jgi:hypothetical protein